MAKSGHSAQISTSFDYLAMPGEGSFRGRLQITTRNRSNLIDGGESPFTMEAAISVKTGVGLSSIRLLILANRLDRRKSQAKLIC